MIIAPFMYGDVDRRGQRTDGPKKRLVGILSGYFLTTQNSRVCSETTMETLDFQKLIEHIYKKLLAKSRDIDEYLTIDALKWEAICSGLR